MKGRSGILRALEVLAPAAAILALLSLSMRPREQELWLSSLLWLLLVALVALVAAYLLGALKRKESPPFVLWLPLALVAAAAINMLFPPIGLLLFALVIIPWLGTIRDWSRGLQPTWAGSGIMPLSGASEAPKSKDVLVLGPIRVYRKTLLRSRVVGRVDEGCRTYRGEEPNEKEFDWALDESGRVYAISGDLRAMVGWVDEKGNVYSENGQPESGFYSYPESRRLFQMPRRFAPGLMGRVSSDGTVYDTRRQKVGHIEGTSDLRIIGALALLFLLR